MRILLPLLLCLLISCGEEAPDCLTSTGNTTTELRNLPPYTEVHVQDNIDVTVNSVNGSQVEVEAGENIIANIKTEVSDGVLRISNENTCNWIRSATRQVKVSVAVGDVTFLIHNGAGELHTAGTLVHDSITLRHYGGGDATLDVKTKYLNLATGNVSSMTLVGSVDHLLVYHNSLGKVDASRLMNMNAYADNMYHGEIIINTWGYLFYQIRGTGNIKSLKHPDTVITVGHAGSGQLIFP